MGPEIRNEKELHGRRVELTREGKKVRGVILAQDLKFSSHEFLFQWTGENGSQKMSPLLEGELEAIRAAESRPVTTDE
jgi:hypothetical protein